MQFLNKIKMSLYQKLSILVFLISMMAILVFGTFTFVQYSNDVKIEKSSLLNNLRDRQLETLDEYYKNLENLILSKSQSLDTKMALSDFEKSYKEIKITEFQKEDLKKNVKIFYENQFKFRVENEFRDVDQVQLDLFLKKSYAFGEQNSQTLYLQNAYLNNPVHPIGFKDKIYYLNDDTKYNLVTHPKYHDKFRKFQVSNNFYDVFLISKENLQIVYSIFKETDYATSLKDGPHKDTNFANMVKKIVNEYESNAFKEPEVYFTDFERYGPSYFAPAAFVMAPIFTTDGDFSGVFAVQIKADNLNRVMANNYQWKKIGLGLTGNSYLVGKDLLLRSDLRLYIQDKETFFKSVTNQDNKKNINRIKNLTTSNLLLKIKNDSVDMAFNRETGIRTSTDIQDKEVLSSYTLFEFKNIKYALVTEMQTHELFGPIRNLFINMSSAVLVALLLAFALTTFLILGLLKPLRNLIEVSERIKLGYYSERARVQTKDEIGELSKSFNEMVNAVETDVIRREKDKQTVSVLKEEAEQASKAKSAFLANMSHELRTPMNAIIGYSEILTEDATDNQHQEYIPDLKKINSAGKHLLQLINDILDISKIEAGKMELDIQDINFASLAQEVADTSDALVTKNGNTLKVIKDESIHHITGDSVKIKQILFNLISNAAKFTENGTITLGYKTHQNDNNFLSIYVQDTGIGIEKDKVAKVFEEFGQADSSTTRKYGGTGLGLSLVKKFVELMGGSIKLESEIGKGSTFTVTIPKNISTPESITEDVKNNEEIETGKKVILVVDDDKSARDLIRRNLEKEGYIVLTASNGDEAIEIANQKNPHLITLDIMMPKKSGWETLKALREYIKFKDTPVIMISMLDDDNTAKGLGADDYLKKPVDRNKLIDAITKQKEKMKNNNIMIIDDLKDNRDIVKRHLKDYNFNFSEADNGKDAIEKLQAKPVDGIILDLMMPVMDGFEFLTRIKEYNQLKDIPIIVLTAKDLNSDEVINIEKDVSLIIQKTDLGEKAIKELVNNLVIEKS